MRQFTYGNLPVPQPVMWSAEEEYFVGICPWFKLPAICQKEAQGDGVPRFGQPHATRLRKILLQGLCDLCGKPLKGSTKISLSTNQFGADRQMEPLLHADCARLSMKHCPALERQAKAGALSVKQVFRYDAVPLPAQPEDVARCVPGYSGPPLVGLAMLHLLDWKDITASFVVGA